MNARRNLDRQLLRALLCVIAIIAATQGKLARAQTRPSDARMLDLLAMGDWGDAKAPQTTVAKALAGYASTRLRPIDAMLLAGDNFYVPLSSINDPAWQELFEQMYDPEKLNFPFYASFGNHDYEQDKAKIELEYARANPKSRWRFPAPWYRIDLPEKQPLATVLMLNSNQPNLTPAAWAQQIAWLETELAKPNNAPWIICCAHHPLFSNGIAADNGILQRDWGTLFKKYHVDFYLCGHEHNLQHLEVPKWNTSFILAGGGGGLSHPMIRDNRGPFSQSVYGFVHFQIQPELATVSYIGAKQNPLHVFQRTKAGQATVLMTTPSDSAIAKPLEGILGIYDKLRRPQTGPATQPATPSDSPFGDPSRRLIPSGN